jgi:hypothetical protein
MEIALVIEMNMASGLTNLSSHIKDMNNDVVVAKLFF